MAKVQVRQGGQLVEKDTSNLGEMATLKGVTTPTTPKGASALGAPADSAKMAGTGVQKKATFQRRDDDITKLRDVQRKEQSKRKPRDIEEEARQKAEDLDRLGSLGVRVQALIKDKFRLDQQAEGRYDKDKIESTIPTDHQGELQQLLEQYIDAPEEAQALADLNNFFQDNDLGDFDPNQWIRTGRGTLAEQAAEQVEDTMVLGELELEPDEESALSEEFGDFWKDWTPEELQAEVLDLEQAEFERIRGLRSMLATATGSHRALLLRELREAGDVGVTGTEAKFDALQDQIDAADTVKFGEEEMLVEDLLKDSTVSNMVSRWFAEEDDSEWRKSLQADNPDFVSWIKGNEESLNELADTVEAEQIELQQIQDDKKGLATIDDANGIVLNDGVMRSMMGEDWDKWTTDVPDISDEPVMQVLTDPQYNLEEVQGLSFAINSATSDTLEMFSGPGITPDFIKQSYDSFREWAENKNFLDDTMEEPIDPNDSFITDTEDQTDIAQKVDIKDSLEGSDNADWAADGEFKQLIKDGEVDQDNIQEIIDNPRHYEQYKEYLALNKKITSIEGSTLEGDEYADMMLDFLFGAEYATAVSVEGVNEELKQLKIYAELAPNSKEGKKYYEMLKMMDVAGPDGEPDGKFSEEDARAMFDKFKEDLSHGDQQSFTDFFSGEAGDKGIFDYREDVLEGEFWKTGTDYRTNPWIDRLSTVFKDSSDKVDPKELEALYRDATYKGDPVALKVLEEVFKNSNYYSVSKYSSVKDIGKQLIQAQEAKAAIDSETYYFGVLKDEMKGSYKSNDGKIGRLAKNKKNDRKKHTMMTLTDPKYLKQLNNAEEVLQKKLDKLATAIDIKESNPEVIAYKKKLRSDLKAEYKKITGAIKTWNKSNAGFYKHFAILDKKDTGTNRRRVKEHLDYLKLLKRNGRFNKVLDKDERMYSEILLSMSTSEIYKLFKG
jgi:hypothetical protein